MSSPGTPIGSQISMSQNSTPRNFINQNQLLSFQSSSQVSRMVDHIITCGANVLYDKYLMERSPFYEAEDICRWTYHMLIQEHFKHDLGETPQSIKNQLTEEQEPPKIRLDSRSCLSAKMDYKIIYPEVEKDDMSETRSNYSRVSGMSKISKASAVRKMKKVLTASQLFGGISNMNMSRTSLQNIEREGSIEEEEVAPKKEEFEVVYVGDDEKEIRRKEDQNDPISEKLRDTREKKDKERQIDQQRRQKMQQEEQEIDDKKKEQERQLKNKEYTSDYDGNVIFLNKNRQENLPTDIVVLDYKNKQQTEIVKTVPLESEIMQSPVKLLNEFTKKKKDLSAAPIQEFHKQPPLHEVLNPSAGIKIKFQTGHQKQGQEFKHLQSQMSKKQYNNLVSDQPNRPIPKYLQNNRQMKVDINDKANQIIELSEHSSNGSTTNKLKRQVKPASSGMHIVNKDQLLLMLQEPSSQVFKKQSSQLMQISAVSIKSAQSIKNIKKSDLIDITKPIGKSIQDKIKVYDKKNQPKEQNFMYQHMSDFDQDEDLQELGINYKEIQRKPMQNLNIVVENFNKKILADPQWGIIKGEIDQIDRPLQTPFKVPHISRVQSAKNYTRPDSAISRFTVKSTHHMNNQSIRPQSGRPTTANTNSRLSQNKHSFFGVKQN